MKYWLFFSVLATIMKVKANNPILCIVVCMLFAGCTDNSIYFDITTEGVCTKRDNNIISLTIEEDGVNYNLYNVELRNDSMATNVFYFDRNNPSYKVVSVLPQRLPFMLRQSEHREEKLVEDGGEKIFLVLEIIEDGPLCLHDYILKIRNSNRIPAPRGKQRIALSQYIRPVL